METGRKSDMDACEAIETIVEAVKDAVKKSGPGGAELMRMRLMWEARARRVSHEAADILNRACDLALAGRCGECRRSIGLLPRM
jgi:molybdopterin biosynthesis enzyme MoaB